MLGVLGATEHGSVRGVRGVRGLLSVRSVRGVRRNDSVAPMLLPLPCPTHS